jgi:uncharacterized OB-fold protein
MTAETETATLTGRALPAVNQDTAFFWEGAKAGKLLIQRCMSCGKLRHPPTPTCPYCHSLDWDAVEASGRGTVYSFVVHYHPPVQGFEVPFVIALIELEEGTRIVSNVTGIDPAAVKIGDKVEVFFIDAAGGMRIPQFRPQPA